MPITDYPELLQVLQSDEKIVYLCGAGVSMALGKHSTSWGAWLQNGKNYLTDLQKTEFDKRIGAKTADSMIDAAGYLLDALKAQGDYHTFMRESFSGLSVKDQVMANGFSQIQRAGDFIATTNYDLLLEQAAGTKTITYSNPGRILKMLCGDEPRRIIHLHGAYDPSDGIDDIIADQNQYRDIVQNQGAQFIQNLIGTHPMIILGCGATVDDPNLSKFLTFVNDHLKLDIPYFYIHKAGDDLSHLNGNMVPVCYGSQYSDLPAFLEDLAAYRLRHRRILRSITSVFPYTPSGKAVSAFGRLHFSNQFAAFVGRKDALQSLDNFCLSAEPFCWWTVTGEGGIGKSRLLLEWLRRLPSDWYGFFGNVRVEPSQYLSLKPFTNTVVVLDYILGREQPCAEIIQNLIQTFEGTPYRLRIILLERQYQPDNVNWLSRVMEGMTPTAKLAVHSCVYGSNSGALIPLHIEPLSEDDERTYIAEYLRAYLPVFTDAQTMRDYFDILDQKCLEIQKGFHGALEPKYRRPLFLSIYIELWVYHKGDVAADGVDQLLEAYLEKEEQRWRSRFGGNSEVLYSYQKLLGLACAVERICINADVDYLQTDADRLTAFLQGEKRAGKKKPDWNELFVCQITEDTSGKNAECIIQDILDQEDVEPEIRYGYAWSMMKILPREDRTGKTPEKYLIFCPEYPDIVRAFIADYYLDEEDLEQFTKTARFISTFEFYEFLIRAIQDFPYKQSFRKMLTIPPEETNGNLEYYMTLLATDGWFDDHETVERVLLSSDRSKEYCFGETELWSRLLAESAGAGDRNAHGTTVNNFLDYLTARLNIEEITEELPEQMEACIAPYYNAKQADSMEAILKKADDLADRIPDNCDIAFACAESYTWLVDLRVHVDRGRGAGRCWERVLYYAKRFPESENIADCLAEISEVWAQDLMEKRLPRRFRRMAEAVEKAYHLHPMETIGQSLATILANEYFLAYEVPGPDTAQITGHCVSEIEKLLASFPDCQEVVSAYACVHSDQYFNMPGTPSISQEETDRFRKWHQLYEDDPEITESFAKVLYMRSQYLKKNGYFKEAKVCIREIKHLAEQADYGEEGNPILEILMLFDE